MQDMRKSLEDICESLEEKYTSLRETAESKCSDLYSRINSNYQDFRSDFDIKELPKHCIDALVSAKNWTKNALTYAAIGGGVPNLISKKLKDNEKIGKYFEVERNFKYSIGFGFVIAAAYIIGGLVVAPAILNSDLFTNPERIRELNLVWNAVGGAAVAKSLIGYGLKIKDYIKSGRDNTKEFLKKNAVGIGVDTLCLLGGSYLLASSISTEMVRKFVSLFALGHIGGTVFDVSSRLGIHFASKKYMDEPLYPATLIPNEAAAVLGYFFYRTLTNLESPVQGLRTKRHYPAEDDEIRYDLFYSLSNLKGINCKFEDNRTIGELEGICEKLGKKYGGRRYWKFVIPREIYADLSALPEDKQEYIMELLNPVQK